MRTKEKGEERKHKRSDINRKERREVWWEESRMEERKDCEVEEGKIHKK